MDTIDNLKLYELLHQASILGRRMKKLDASPLQNQPDTSYPRQLNFAQARILSLLLENGMMSQKRLTRLLGIRPQSLYETINKLVSGGLIEKFDTANTKRGFSIQLTEAGHTYAENLQHDMRIRADDFFSPLEEEEKQLLFNVLAKLTSLSNIK